MIDDLEGVQATMDDRYGQERKESTMKAAQRNSSQYPVMDGKRLRLEHNHGGGWSVYSRNWVYYLGTVFLHRDRWWARDSDQRTILGTYPTREKAVARLAENLPQSAR